MNIISHKQVHPMRWKRRPLTAVEKVLGKRLYPWQKEIVSGLRSVKRIRLK